MCAWTAWPACLVVYEALTARRVISGVSIKRDLFQEG